MDYDQTGTPPRFQSPSYEPRQKTSLWRILSSVMLVMSILANGFLLLAIIGMAAVMTTGKTGDNLVETTLVSGSRHQKIAAIRIEGIIDGAMSDWVSKQLEAAENDPAVQGIIVRIISPGGGVSSSDQIHYAISRYKERTGQPVLAFMQSMAASGGYYAAVACDEIMAEPTVITGSIGVIMSHLVVKELLEQKLGISPVVLKSGERKDWPSMFSETTDEQKQYLDERLIQPAYERFVQLVADGRKDKLSEREVRTLADGGIYTAPEALTCKLIDQIGYFEQAVAAISDRAGVGNPTVVEYSEKFSMLSILGAEAKTGLTIDAELFDKLLTPQLMYLWDGRR
jgi:protease-4